MNDLDAFFTESRASIDGKIEARNRTLDFVDVVERAHAIDSDVVPAASVQEASDLAVVVDIRSGSAEPPADPELDHFFSEVRGAVDEQVLDRQLAPIPALRAAQPRGMSKAVLGSVVAAAAAVLIGWLALSGDARLLTADDAPQSSEQAVNMGVRDASTQGDAVERLPAKTRPRSVAPPTSIPEEEVAEPEVEPAEDPELVEIVEADPPPKPSVDRPQTRDARLQTLLDTAKTQWRGGDRAAAKKTLAQVVRTGGRSRHVQSAYADLFVLAHHGDKNGERRRLWRSYLRRFPRGRYADDARAGLCRTAKPSKSERCWSAYLEDFSGGSYRAEATRALR